MNSSKDSYVTELDPAEVRRAQLQMSEHLIGFTPLAVAKCAVELQIPDVLEAHGGAMTHSDLSAALGCSPAILHRIMRYLIHCGIFKLQDNQDSSSTCYMQTPLSKVLMRKGEHSIASSVLLQRSPSMIDPWHMLSRQALASQEGSSFKATYGKEIWEHAASDPSFTKLFGDVMSSSSKMAMLAVIEHCSEVFEGIKCLVDVGGNDGTSLRMLVKAFPWIHGINFDLPHVVSLAPHCDGIQHIAGNMFEMVPKADAVLLKWILHDWGDEECIQILTKCREAIPEGTGKVVILEAVIGVNGGKYNDMHLAFDMGMLVNTETGKERTLKEWEQLIKAAGFKKFNVKDTKSISSVIEAYP